MSRIGQKLLKRFPNVYERSGPVPHEYELELVKTDAGDELLRYRRIGYSGEYDWHPVPEPYSSMVMMAWKLSRSETCDDLKKDLLEKFGPDYPTVHEMCRMLNRRAVDVNGNGSSGVR